MKYYSLCILSAILLFPFGGIAQINYGLSPIDSIVLDFSRNAYDTSIIKPDSNINPLWQLGLTHKSFFSTSPSGVKGMMTDTINPYPINANNWFVLKVHPLLFDEIVTIWHRYKTDSIHAGGIVEYSMDNGLHWANVKGACNTDGLGGPGLHTENFYSANDTLLSGEPCFKGEKGPMVSKIQIRFPDPIERISSGTPGCPFSFYETFFGTGALFRFRFMSDSLATPKDGWMIDSISLRWDMYDGLINGPNHSLIFTPAPNPSSNGKFAFPTIAGDDYFFIEVTNTIGTKICSIPYTHLLDLGNYPKGIYFYKILTGTAVYQGKLIYE